MNQPNIPNFGELLAEFITGISPESIPVLLANLERGAGERYRQWATDLPEFSENILASADREDDIANRAEKMFPISEDQQKVIEEIVPRAKATYMEVFDGLTPIQQMTIQANAERQGASAWRGMIDAYPQFSDELEQLAQIEEASADQLDSLLASFS